MLYFLRDDLGRMDECLLVYLWLKVTLEARVQNASQSGLAEGIR